MVEFLDRRREEEERRRRSDTGITG